MRSVHSLRPAGLLLGMMMAVISCSEKEDSQAGEWKGSTRFENGVQIVVNPKEPMYGPEAVRLIYEMEFGVSEGDENEMLGGISAFAVDPSENAYIYDSKAGQVKIFDKSGHFMNSALSIPTASSSKRLSTPTPFEKSTMPTNRASWK